MGIEQSMLPNTPEDFIHQHVCGKRNVAKEYVEFGSQIRCTRMLASVTANGGD